MCKTLHATTPPLLSQAICSFNIYMNLMDRKLCTHSDCFNIEEKFKEWIELIFYKIIFHLNSHECDSSNEKQKLPYSFQFDWEILWEIQSRKMKQADVEDLEIRPLIFDDANFHSSTRNEIEKRK